MNTLRNEVSGVILANEIRLQRAVHKGSFLIVEGVSDASLFKKFVDEHQCAITVSLGKKNVFEAITILHGADVVGVLGVVDKDFCEIIGYPDFTGDIFFTDQNDFEIMILCSSALQNILVEFGIDDRIAALEKASGRRINELIFDAASFLGALRMISFRDGWNLRFEGMKYRFVDANSFELDETRTVQHVLGRSHSLRPIAEDELVNFMKSERDKREDGRDICCGHDCVRQLGRALRVKIGNTNQFNSEEGAKLLEQILRVAYDLDQFRTTNVYRSIQDWEKRSRYHVLREYPHTVYPLHLPRVREKRH